MHSGSAPSERLTSSCPVTHARPSRQPRRGVAADATNCGARVIETLPPIQKNPKRGVWSRDSTRIGSRGVRDGGRYRVAVDIGGTFVDAIEFDRESGSVRLAKASTTPARPAEGVMDALRRLGTPIRSVDVLIHGTTLGLNAILDRKGARTGILTNAGFRDLFEIGRGDVPREQMYNFKYRRPPPLVSRRHRLGVPGRMDAQGRVVEPLNEQAVRQA